ncbi:hypothetical protein FAUST_11733 [Fusarium austroamericanum]|uniref:Uncharacterized protein n=1 Tax=Fusarium austroamericanum TaxID=282268 RepID=A0AAN6BUJ5_FUSAU|nr:hypothetical protein FAUST_11733 [Fusarium austroamericanum]
MSTPVKETAPKRMELGDDMDDFVLVLDPARRVKPRGAVQGEKQKKKTTTYNAAISGSALMPQGNKTQDSAESPTPATKKALDEYHVEMRKVAEASMPERDGLRVPCEDWFCTNRGSARFNLDAEI